MHAVLIEIAGLRPGAPTASLVRTLSAQSGVAHVTVNAASRQVTVLYDPNRTTVGQLRALITRCGLHCVSHVASDAPCLDSSPTGIE